MACGWHDVLLPEIRTIIHTHLDIFSFRILSWVSRRDYDEVHATDRARVGPPMPTLPPCITENGLAKVVYSHQLPMADLAYFCGHERAAIKLKLYNEAKRWTIIATESVRSLALRKINETWDMDTIRWAIKYRLTLALTHLTRRETAQCDWWISYHVEQAMRREDDRFLTECVDLVSIRSVPVLIRSVLTLYYYYTSNGWHTSSFKRRISRKWRRFVDRLIEYDGAHLEVPFVYTHTGLAYRVHLPVDKAVKMYNEFGVLPPVDYLRNIIYEHSDCEETILAKLLILHKAGILWRMNCDQFVTDIILTHKPKVLRFVWESVPVIFSLEEHLKLAKDEGADEMIEFIKSKA